MTSLQDLVNRMGSKPTGQSFGMLFGDSGTGKSYLATRILDRIVEPGKSIVHYDTSGSFYRLDHEAMGVTHKFVPLPHEYIEDIEALLDAIQQKVAPFDNVGGLILDELSQVAQEDLDRVYTSRRANNPSIEETADWNDFRPALTRMRTKVINKAQRAGVHTVIIAHERKQKPEDGGKWIPDFSPATLVKVKAPLDYVARTTATDEAPPGSKETVYRREVQLNPTRGVDAKNGMGIPFVQIESQYFPDGVAKWLDAKTPAQVVQAEVTDNLATNPFEKIED